MSCDCGQWQISGFPCAHAAAVIDYCGQYTHEYTHWYYSKEAFKLTYGGTINPIPDPSMWPDAEGAPPKPPKRRNVVGRPKKNRRREPDEGPAPSKSFTKHCKSCGSYRHNKRTCSKVNQQPSRGRGHTRKQSSGNSGQPLNQTNSTVFQHQMPPPRSNSDVCSQIAAAVGDDEEDQFGGGSPSISSSFSLLAAAAVGDDEEDRWHQEELFHICSSAAPPVFYEVLMLPTTTEYRDVEVRRTLQSYVRLLEKEGPVKRLQIDIYERGGVREGLEIEKVANNVFAFNFNSMDDRIHVMAGGPWTFDGPLIVLAEPSGKGDVRWEKQTILAFPTT
ncbi:hypothetical protein EZV62_009188 [Acer yangbiense]|uniref:SWIM-type domain-containing protein n=1 Tax=Acer yangbiense TaxID=1000413 RepID=A0A5C7IFB7_9ROSI|nr:hypothetical protein EZV62_009188 [Acer yangbiense]